MSLVDQFGRVIPPTNDPAYQPPREPSAEERRTQAGIVYREIPISVVATGWDVPSARAAMSDMVLGIFDGPAQLTDAVIRSDSRTQAALTSRLSILGRPVDFRLPRKYRDSAAARECLDAFVDAWPTMTAESQFGELQRWAIMMGFGIAQLLWDTSGDYAIPRPEVWHPRYTYYHWLYRCYVAITLDGQVPIVPGNGSWMLHVPQGGQRGWMRGAIGAVTPWWLARHYALRDWARYSERHGLPMIKAKTPAVGDPIQQALFRSALAQLGQETVIHLPQNPPPALSYDVELLEAKDTAHEGFRMLIESCNGEITLALLAQQLTTAMPAEGGSSYAAARVHAGVLQGLLESDARALAMTAYAQLARPFAAVNFGLADLAPRVVWDVTPFEDASTKATAFASIANALNLMRSAGYTLSARDVRRLLRETIPGFAIGNVQDVEPLDLAKANASAASKQSDTRARIASFAARFDPQSRMRIAVPDQAAELREAMAEIEAMHDERAREARRNERRYTP